jgi:hypothetical protein
LLFEVGQKELFVLLWLVILFTIVVWGRTEGVICIVLVSYIVDHYCLKSDREVVCIVVTGYIVDYYFLRFGRSDLYWWGMFCIVVVDIIVDHYCLRFDKGVVCIVMICYFVCNSFLRFDRKVVCIVVAGYVVCIAFWGLTEEWFVLMRLVILSAIT